MKLRGTNLTVEQPGLDEKNCCTLEAATMLIEVLEDDSKLREGKRRETRIGAPSLFVIFKTVTE